MTTVNRLGHAATVALLTITSMLTWACSEGADERQQGRRSGGVVAKPVSENATPVTTPAVSPTVATSIPLTIDELISKFRMGISSVRFLLSAKLKNSDPAKFKLYDDSLIFLQDNSIAFLKGKDPVASAKVINDYIELHKADFKIKDADLPNIKSSTEALHIQLAKDRDSGALLKKSPLELGMSLIAAMPPSLLTDLGEGFDIASLASLFSSLSP